MVMEGIPPSAMKINQFLTWVRRCLAFSSCRLPWPVMCFFHMLRTCSVKHQEKHNTIRCHCIYIYTADDVAALNQAHKLAVP